MLDWDYEMFRDRYLRRTITSDTGCLIWQGYKDKDGYAHIEIRRKWWQLHRFIYFCSLETREQRQEFLDSGDIVMHTCDTPACINIEHLRRGTQQDNILDAVDKDRWPNRRGNAKLSQEQVLAIRREYKDTPSSEGSIARQYGVSVATISRIVHNGSWKGL